jgi:hypothetical protein
MNKKVHIKNRINILVDVIYFFTFFSVHKIKSTFMICLAINLYNKDKVLLC